MGRRPGLEDNASEARRIRLQSPTPGEIGGVAMTECSASPAQSPLGKGPVVVRYDGGDPTADAEVLSVGVQD